MGENITKIKVGDDERCISLDTEVIDIMTFARDSVGKLCVKLGSSMYSDNGSNGIGVKIHPDTQNYLQPEHYGLSLKLDTMADAMAEAMAEAVGKKLGLAIDGYNNELVIGTAPLRLGTGLNGGDNGKTLCLSLGSGLDIQPIERKIRVKLDDEQHLIVAPAGGALKFNLNQLYILLEARYNLTKK